METKETLHRTNIESSILHDTDYYKYIFKKTEKIVCAVFYIMHTGPSIGQNTHVVNDLENSAGRLLECSLRSLRDTSYTVTETAIEIKFALMTLESYLRLASSVRILSTELLEVFMHEIDSVQRSLRKYTESSVPNPLLNASATSRPEVLHARRSIRTKVPVQEMSSHATLSTSLISRRERVLAVIKDKNEATIKDVVESVTDCSEKTIQRELTALIKDNIIVRRGERRWSKYSLI